MSVQHVGAVLDSRHPALESTRKLVLICIANRSDQNGLSWPTQALLAAECGIAERSVRDHLKALEQAKFISRETQHLGHGKGSRTIFRIHLETLANAPAKSAPAKSAAASAPAKYDTCTGNGPPLTNLQEPTISKAGALEGARENSPPPRKPNPQKGRGKVRGAARATSIPEHWNPGPMGYAYATSKGLTSAEINHEIEKFRAFYGARSGTKAGRFTDWHKCWTGWILRAIDYGNVAAARPQPASQPRHNYGADDFVGALERAAMRAGARMDRAQQSPLLPDCHAIGAGHHAGAGAAVVEFPERLSSADRPGYGPDVFEEADWTLSTSPAGR